MAGPKQLTSDEILRNRRRAIESTEKALENYKKNKNKNTKESLAKIIVDLLEESLWDEIEEILDAAPDLDLSKYITYTHLKKITYKNDLLERLIKNHNVNINAQNSEGGTVMSHNWLTVEEFKSLISLNANLDIKDKKGNTPLTRLIKSCETNKLKILHEHNRDKLFEADENGKRPIDRILEKLNPTNDTWQYKRIMDELGFTEEEVNRVGTVIPPEEKHSLRERAIHKQAAEDMALEYYVQQQRILADPTSSSYERIVAVMGYDYHLQRNATFRFQTAILKNNFKDALEIIKNDYFSVNEGIFKQKKRVLIFKLLRSEDPDATDILNKLIDQGLDLSDEFKGRMSYPHYIAKESPLPDRFIDLLKKQPSLNKTENDEGYTPVDLFVRRKDINLALIKNIQTINPQLLLQPNRNGQNPITLFLANINPNNDPKKNKELVESLELSQKERDKVLNKNGTCKSSQLGLIDIIKVKAGSGSLNLIDKVIRDEMTEGLSKQEIKVINKPDGNGKTALIHAAIGGYSKAAQILTDKGADLDLADKTGKTALHYAIQNNRIDLASQLIDGGANPDIADKTGKTPLHYALENKHTDVAIHLINKGARVDIADIEDNKALNLAVQIGNKDLTELILIKMDKEYSKNSETIGKSILYCNLETLKSIIKVIEFPHNKNPLDILLFKFSRYDKCKENDRKIKFLVEQGIEPSKDFIVKSKVHLIAEAFDLKGTRWEEIKPQIKINQTNKDTEQAHDPKWAQIKINQTNKDTEQAHDPKWATGLRRRNIGTVRGV